MSEENSKENQQLHILVMHIFYVGKFIIIDSKNEITTYI